MHPPSRSPIEAIKAHPRFQTLVLGNEHPDGLHCSDVKEQGDCKKEVEPDLHHSDASFHLHDKGHH
jgi:hypothetical protein